MTMDKFTHPIKDNLTSVNFWNYAEQYYVSNMAYSTQEILSDVELIKYIKRALKRYQEENDIKVLLVINHLKIFYNVFDKHAATKMLFLKIEPDLWPCLKPFLVWLNVIPEKIKNVNSADIDTVSISMDQQLVYLIRKMK